MAKVVDIPGGLWLWAQRRAEQAIEAWHSVGLTNTQIFEGLGLSAYVNPCDEATYNAIVQAVLALKRDFPVIPEGATVEDYEAALAELQQLEGAGREGRPDPGGSRIRPAARMGYALERPPPGEKEAGAKPERHSA